MLDDVVLHLTPKPRLQSCVLNLPPQALAINFFLGHVQMSTISTTAVGGTATQCSWEDTVVGSVSEYTQQGK